MQERYTTISLKFIHRMKYISGNAVKVYLALKQAENKERNGNEVWPSYNFIKRLTGLTQNTQVSNAITELKYLGYIVKIEKGYNSVNHYFLGEIENEEEFLQAVTQTENYKKEQSEKEKARKEKYKSQVVSQTTRTSVTDNIPVVSQTTSNYLNRTNLITNLITEPFAKAQGSLIDNDSLEDNDKSSIQSIEEDCSAKASQSSKWILSKEEMNNIFEQMHSMQSEGDSSPNGSLPKSEDIPSEGEQVAVPSNEQVRVFREPDNLDKNLLIEDGKDKFFLKQLGKESFDSVDEKEQYYSLKNAFLQKHVDWNFYTQKLTGDTYSSFIRRIITLVG
jgi:hypothetical protein